MSSLILQRNRSASFERKYRKAWKCFFAILKGNGFWDVICNLELIYLEYWCYTFYCHETYSCCRNCLIKVRASFLDWPKIWLPFGLWKLYEAATCLIAMHKCIIIAWCPNCKHITFCRWPDFPWREKPENLVKNCQPFSDWLWIGTSILYPLQEFFIQYYHRISLLEVHLQTVEKKAPANPKTDFFS